MIQQILDRVNLVSLIGEQVKLRKTGRNYSGLCPFHADSDPSFSVNPERGFFHCFGCKESGNAISYMMKARGLDFVGSVEALAGYVGIELEYENEGDRAAWDRQRALRQRLLEVNHEAHKWFRSNLTRPEGEAGRAYLTQRGVSREMVSAFQLGVCPRGTGLYDHFVRSGAPLNLAQDLGLVVKSRRGNYVDKLGSRLIFPVLTVADEVAGFSGRSLPDGPDPKYLNSPDSEVFRKGELLFGLVQGRRALKQKDYCLLVEGQLDVIALHQAGLGNAVAPLGTALTEHQAAVIRRFTPNVVLMFDGDPAGLKATWRGMAVLMGQGLYGRVATLPKGEDPDSLLRQGGPEALERLVEAAQPFLEYAAESLVREAGRDLHGRTEAARRGLEFASSIQSSLDRQVFLDRLASDLRVSPEALRAEAVVLRQRERRVVREEGAPEASAPAEPVEDIARLERRLMQMVLLRPDMVRLVCEDEVFELIVSERVRKFFLQMLDEFEECGRVEAEEVVSRITDDGLRSLCARWLVEGSEMEEAAVEKAIHEMVRTLREGKLKDELARVSADIARAESRGDIAAALDLTQERDQVWRELAHLSGGGRQRAS